MSPRSPAIFWGGFEETAVIEPVAAEIDCVSAAMCKTKKKRTKIGFDQHKAQTPTAAVLIFGECIICWR